MLKFARSRLAKWLVSRYKGPILQEVEEWAKSGPGKKWMNKQFTKTVAPELQSWLKTPSGQRSVRETVGKGLVYLAKEHKAPVALAGLSTLGLTSGVLASMIRSRRHQREIEELRKKLKLRGIRRDVTAEDMAKELMSIAVGGEAAEKLVSGFKRNGTR